MKLKEGRIILFLVMSLCFSFGLKAQKLVDKVVAQVGSEYILLSDVEKQFSYLQESSGTISDKERCSILEGLMAQKIMVDQAKLDSIIVMDSEVEQQLDYRVESILRQMNGDTEFFEEYYGQTIPEVKAWMRVNMKEMLLAERMRGSLFEGITITPSETKAFFNRIPSDSLPYFSSEVEVAEIVLVPQVNEEEKQKSYDAAIAVHKELMLNEGDFAALAKKYSADPGSKRLGGDLGWQTRGTFVPEFDAVAYTLTKNEISEPFESPFGYHIVQLLDRRGNTVHTRHILFKPELTYDDIEKTKQKLIGIREEIIVDSISFQKAIKKYSSKDEESFNNNGRLTNPVNGTTFFETADLPPDIYFEIEKIEVNGITEPIEYTSPRGETQFRIIKLLSKTRPHKANLEQDYAKIQFYAKENKKNEYFGKWVQEKAAKKYVQLDERFSSCPDLEFWGKENTKAEN
jgi:peptidyl-prolyl cis-trans isomerase SurA